MTNEDRASVIFKSFLYFIVKVLRQDFHNYFIEAKGLVSALFFNIK